MHWDSLTGVEPMGCPEGGTEIPMQEMCHIPKKPLAAELQYMARGKQIPVRSLYRQSTLHAETPPEYYSVDICTSQFQRARNMEGEEDSLTGVRECDAKIN